MRRSWTFSMSGPYLTHPREHPLVTHDAHAHQHGEASTGLVPAPLKYTERYKKPRVFVRAVESERYTLTEQQREMRASVPRLIRPKVGFGTSEDWNIMQPGDEPFRTQSLHVHFV